WLPPGAASTRLRSLSYFPEASTVLRGIILGGWAAVGVILTLLDRSRRSAVAPAAVSVASCQMDVRHWCDRGGGDYARFRPGYPPELVDVLVDAAPDSAVAIDVGCGTGKLTVRLADRFDAVIGIDPSEDHLANAIGHDRVRYVC